MCEDCDKMRAEALKEISELLDDDSELVAGLRKRAEKHPDGRDMNEEELQRTILSVRLQAIGEAAAIAASATPGSRHHGLPPHYILGNWAHAAMRYDPIGALAGILAGEGTTLNVGVIRMSDLLRDLDDGDDLLSRFRPDSMND